MAKKEISFSRPEKHFSKNHSNLNFGICAQFLSTFDNLAFLLFLANVPEPFDHHTAEKLFAA
jgi:hypothetical protein